MSSYIFASEELVTQPRVCRLPLRSIDDAGVKAFRVLFSRDAVLVGEAPELTWRFSWLARGVARQGVILRGVGVEMLLSIAEDGLREPLGCREWWDYTDESSFLAWTLAHTVVVEALGRLLREPLFPDGWREAAEAQLQTDVTLAFEAVGADQKTSRGELLLPPVMLARLAASSGWAKAVPAVEVWGGCLAADLRIVLPGDGLPCWELLAARGGDVLVLGARSQCWRRLTLIYPAPTTPNGEAVAWRSWGARYDDGRLEIAGAALDDATRFLMSESIAEDTGAAARGNGLEGVPVTLDFELGSLSVPLGELAALKPGYVFTLAARLEEARVVIRANRTPIGYGEIVAAGETLGVQLLSIDARGLR